MEELINKLKAIIDNPDDLSALPKIISDIEVKSEELNEALDHVGRLHELNRKYLKMIPITDELEKKEEEEETVTVDDAVAEIMKGVN